MQITLINAKLKLNELIEINCSVFCHFDHFLGPSGPCPGPNNAKSLFYNRNFSEICHATFVRSVSHVLNPTVQFKKIYTIFSILRIRVDDRVDTPR